MGAGLQFCFDTVLNMLATSKVIQRLILGWLLLLAIPAAFSQSADLLLKIESLKPAVVSISSFWPAVSGQDIDNETGMGLVVSNAAGRVVVATAGHVVVSRGTYRLADKLIVRNYLGSSYPARIVAFSKDPELDLAFIELIGSVDIGSPSLDIMADRKAMQSTQAWIFGAYGKWLIQGGTGAIKKINSGRLLIEGVDGVPSQSGAPIVSSDGVLGLYVGSGAGGRAAREVGLNDISAEAKRLGVPFRLETSQWVVRSVLTHLVRSDRFSNEVSFRSLRTGRSFPVPGDYELPTGEYAMAFDMKIAFCTPLSKIVRESDQDRRIGVNCGPNPIGEWRSDGMRLTLLPINAWEYSALTKGSVGDADRALELNFSTDGSGGFLVSGRSMLSGETYSGTAKMSASLRVLVLRLESAATGQVIQEEMERR